MSTSLPSSAGQSLADLRAEMVRVCQEIAAAEAEDALYSGGLVKSMIAVRLQVIRTTKALIEQRIHALESGAPITVVTQAADPDEPRAKHLAEELQTQSELLQQARAEASLYTGGLVYSLKLSTVATHEQTLANLSQQSLLARYGLVLPAPAPCTTAPATSNAAQPAIQIPSEPLPTLFEIIKVDARVTEANQSWSRYAWQLTVRSLAKVPLQLEAKIEFQDAQGFIIADHSEYNLILSAGNEDIFGGSSLITSAVAGNIHTVAAKVKAT